MPRYEQTLAQNGVHIPDILLPAPDVDLATWAVVACDQFTAEPNYWQQVEELVGDAPSTFRITFPEVYLSQGMGRVQGIQAAMRDYQARGVLRHATHGFVLVERQTSTGNRLGLVLAVDLEAYDFAPGARSLIRPTEGTIEERIPPRVKVREGAPLESPHVMLLVDDPARTLIEPLYAVREALRPLYDVELMKNGGHLRGWAVEEGPQLEQVAQALAGLGERAEGLLFAVGDGNHSLATARQCWLNLRDTLTEAQRAEHPARFALAEVVNLHDDALVFEPIHRMLFPFSPEEMRAAWVRHSYGRNLGIEFAPPAPGQQGGQVLWFEGVTPWRFTPREGELAVGVLQDFLDDLLIQYPQVEIDYIHGEASLRSLCRGYDTMGLLLPSMNKADLFPAVRARGALPRKTFSMGEANEKRYYMECRGIG